MRKCLRELKKKEGPAATLQHAFVSISNIDPLLITMVDIAESRGCFMYEGGFNGGAYIRAHRSNRKGNPLRGGSTVSQQSAKNFFLPFDRTYLRKFIEAHYVSLIELIWGKKRIMEYYLNCVEFGSGLFGCQAACRFYFGHDVSHLTPQEACMLAVTLPAPRNHNPNSQSPYYCKSYEKLMKKYPDFSPTNLDVRYPNTTPKLVDLSSTSLFQFGIWLVYYETKRFFQKLR